VSDSSSRNVGNINSTHASEAKIECGPSTQASASSVSEILSTNPCCLGQEQMLEDDGHMDRR
jgi:hypothetical protein